MTEDGLPISRRTALKKGAIATGAVVFGGTAATGTAAAGLGDGRVGHYNLNSLHLNKDTDEKIKNFVHDASTYKNHGTNVDNGADVVKDGAVGKAFEFDGTDDYVNVPDDSSLDIQDELTIAFWFKLDGTSNDNTFPRAVSKGQSTGSNGAYGVFIEDGDGGANFIGLRFIDEGGNKNDIKNKNLDPYDDGMWHHVAATYSNSNNVGRLYFDNSKVAEETISDGVSIRKTDDDLHLGDGNGERHLNGYLDDVHIYNRALSSAEVTELYEKKD